MLKWDANWKEKWIFQVCIYSNHGGPSILNAWWWGGHNGTKIFFNSYLNSCTLFNFTRYILFTWFNSWFWSYKSEFSEFYDKLEQVLQVLFDYLLWFFLSKSIWVVKISWKFRIHIVSELVVWSHEQVLERRNK